MIETITYKDKKYPKFQAEGHAAKYVFPFAKEVCKGVGYDIGCAKIEWAFPGAIPIDLVFNNGYDALTLPIDQVDYIFSSHCLEHVNDWVITLEYWIDHLYPGGTLFLYLPHWDQEYWRPWNNRKHKHVLQPEVIKELLISKNMKNIYVSGIDLNHSFCIIAEK